jgi:CHAD domain-containing protein
VKLNPQPVEKPLRRLRKVLKQFVDPPRPNDVHSLRTQTRRLEAIIAALGVEETSQPRHLLKLITPLRKAAGQVRDMDVLISDLFTLAKDRQHQRAPAADPASSLVRLTESLAEMRRKRARKLSKLVARHGHKARKSLKQYARLLESRVADHSFAADLRARPQILITELRHWPRLDEANLHPFRIKVKALSYMLQLARDADARLVQHLNAVKDTIGAWHDWSELLTMARKVLDPEEDREALRQIESIQRQKLHVAFTSAHALRKDYLDAHDSDHADPLQKAAGF